MNRFIEIDELYRQIFQNETFQRQRLVDNIVLFKKQLREMLTDSYILEIVFNLLDPEHKVIEQAEDFILTSCKSHPDYECFLLNEDNAEDVIVRLNKKFNNNIIKYVVYNTNYVFSSFIDMFFISLLQKYDILNLEPIEYQFIKNVVYK